MLGGMKAQVVGSIPVKERTCGHHFGVQQGVLTDEAHHVPVMTVRSLHHWSDADRWALGATRGHWGALTQIG